MLKYRKQFSVALLIAPAMVLIAMFLVWPVVDLIAKSFIHPDGPFASYKRLFEIPVYLQILGRTFLISFVTACLCLVLGYPVAYALTRASRIGKVVILICVLLPFWTNLLVRTFGWIQLLNPSGVINTLLMSFNIINEPFDLIYNPTGVIISLTQIMLPYMILPLYAVMTRMDYNLLLAARSLGAKPSYTFLKLYFPLTFPGVMAGMLLIFAMSLGFFIIPALVGGAKGTMIAQLIEFNINSTLNWSMASALSVCLLIATMIVYWIANRWFNLSAIWGLSK